MSKIILTALAVLSMFLVGIGQASAQQLNCYVAAVIYQNGNKIPANVLARVPDGADPNAVAVWFKNRAYQWAGTTSANYDISEVAANSCISNAKAFKNNHRDYWRSLGYPKATGKIFYKLE